MKLLLCAVNAKYIHSNLAVYSLKAYSEAVGADKDWEIKLKEYTINHYQDDILQDIYQEKADVVVFSCYIWNMNIIYDICGDFKLASPNTEIWLGGPEVSYDSEKVLKEHPEISLVMNGEGEKTFAELLSGSAKTQIAGITYRDKDTICQNPPAPLMSMDEIPFVYQDMKDFEHKIVYYETSRGCPFSCSYCLSSIDKTVRFRSLDKVFEELHFFMEHKVPQVKFVDRTFNCNRAHSRAIWKYLLEQDNGFTNFHFEVSADLIEDEDLRIMEKMRPGLIQLEIGVQSTFAPTIHEIHRTMDLDKLKNKVSRIKSMRNIHQHLDLIAGLPYEDLETFRRSFNDVYSMEPDQLQLGFLKVLKGSYMAENAAAYDLIYRHKPVYEVISTKWLSYDDVLLLKKVEEMVEVYYNSSQFRFTLEYLLHFAHTPFDFYKELGEYYVAKGLHDRKHNRPARYEILLDFAKEMGYGDAEIVREILTYDLYLRENMKSRPAWAKNLNVWNKKYLEFFRQEEGARRYIEDEPYDSRKAARQYHLEYWDFDVEETALAGVKSGESGHVLFDYNHRNPLSGDGNTRKIKHFLLD